VSSKATLPPAASATDAPKARASAPIRQKRTRAC
jgi:anthranilate/para-aminobenzoate synthase component I